MAYQIHEMSGSLFRSKEKRSDKSPDYTGSCVIHGKKFNVSGWIKQSGSGVKYMSLAFTADGGGPSQQQAKSSSAPANTPAATSSAPQNGNASNRSGSDDVIPF